MSHICSLYCQLVFTPWLCYFVQKINSEKSSQISVLLWELCWFSRAQEGTGASGVGAIVYLTDDGCALPRPRPFLPQVCLSLTLRSTKVAPLWGDEKCWGHGGHLTPPTGYTPWGLSWAIWPPWLEVLYMRDLWPFDTVCKTASPILRCAPNKSLRLSPMSLQ